MQSDLLKQTYVLQKTKIEKMKSCKGAYKVEVLNKEIIVHPNVFYPATDTKLLINSITPHPEDTCLETFAGTGCIAIFLALNSKEVVATDINPDAIKNIEANIKLYNLENKMKALHADIFPNINKKFDIIALNPPYSDFEANDVVEKALWDKDHKSLHTFFKEARNYLTLKGTIYSTWANFADFDFFIDLVKKYNYTIKQINEITKDMKIYRVFEIKPREIN